MAWIVTVKSPDEVYGPSAQVRVTSFTTRVEGEEGAKQTAVHQLGRLGATRVEAVSAYEERLQYPDMADPEEERTGG